MKNREIYEAALVKLDEPLNEGENPDYDERAPFLIAQFCRLANEVDAKYRVAYGMEKRKGKILVCPELDDEFILCDAFIAPAISYLAAELVQRSDEALSERFTDEWTDCMATIECTLPMALESISDRYAF